MPKLAFKFFLSKLYASKNIKINFNSEIKNTHHTNKTK